MHLGSTRWLAAVALLGFAAPSRADEPAAAANDWQFAATLYGWVSDLEGDVRAAEGIEPAAVDLSHGDILNHLKFAAFGSFEVRKDRLVFMTDLTFAHIGASSGVGPGDADLIDAELDASTFTGTLLGGYRVAQGEVDVDLLAGGRLVINDTDLVLSGPLRTVAGDVTKKWIDPIVAVQIGVPVARHTTLTFYGDMGAGASDFTWQAIAGVRHRISGHLQLTAGWRHYVVDYDDGAFLYDVRQTGPVVGARIEF